MWTSDFSCFYPWLCVVLLIGCPFLASGYESWAVGVEVMSARFFFLFVLLDATLSSFCEDSRPRLVCWVVIWNSSFASDVRDLQSLERCFISECVASLLSCSLRCDCTSAHLVLFCLNCQSATCVIYQCLWRMKSSVKEWKPAFCLNDARSLDPYGAFAVNRLAYFLSVIYHTRRALWFTTVIDFTLLRVSFFSLHIRFACVSLRGFIRLYFCSVTVIF